MPKKPQPDPIYTDDYYRLEKLVNDSRFQKRIQQQRALYKQLGCPIPARGFRKYQRYIAWLNKFWAAHAKIEYGELARERQLIQNNPSLSEREKFQQAAEAEERLLPLPPGNFFEELLQEFALDPRNEKYKDFLEGYTFLGKKHLSEPFFRISYKRNEKTDEWELFIQLYPYTKQEHINAFWGEIAQDQQRLKGWRGKNKKWEQFDRDLHIFNVYQEIKSTMPGKRVTKASGFFAIDVAVWNTLRKVDKVRFKDLTLSQVRKAVTRIASLNEDFPFKRTT